MTDYTDLLRGLREQHLVYNAPHTLKAAIAIETLLAEVERWRVGWGKGVSGLLNVLMKEAADEIETLLAERKVLMQLVETVQRERDKLIEQNKELFDSALLAAQERDAAMADARRYRWLIADYTMVDRIYEWLKELSIDDFNAAVDAAMKESGNETA